MVRVKPPRGAFINFPLGRPCGKPDDSLLQRRILKDALSILGTASRPGEIVGLLYEWDTPFDWASYRQDVEDMCREEGIPPEEWKAQG
jgi:hypothetical protein